MENVGTFFGHLEYIATLFFICGILWLFGVFSPFWYIVSIKIGNPDPDLFLPSFIFQSAR
jgi:hypothetical protein